MPVTIYYLFFKKAATSAALRVFGHCLAFDCMAVFLTSLVLTVALFLTLPLKELRDFEPSKKYLRWFLAGFIFVLLPRLSELMVFTVPLYFLRFAAGLMLELLPRSSELMVADVPLYFL